MITGYYRDRKLSELRQLAEQDEKTFPGTKKRVGKSPRPFQIFTFFLTSLPDNPRHRSAAKGDKPTGVDGQTHTMEETIHRFGPTNHARNERQHEMKCHAGQGGDADRYVPLGHYAAGEAVAQHQVGPQIVADKSNPENQQMLSMESPPAGAENGPGVEEQGEVHTDYGLKQHRIVTSPASEYAAVERN